MANLLLLLEKGSERPAPLSLPLFSVQFSVFQKYRGSPCHCHFSHFQILNSSEAEHITLFITFQQNFIPNNNSPDKNSEMLSELHPALDANEAH